jgi:hypothetical protein
MIFQGRLPYRHLPTAANAVTSANRLLSVSEFVG